MIKHQPDVEKTFWYAKDLCKSKYQLLIKKCKKVGLKHFKERKAFMKYSDKTNDFTRVLEKGPESFGIVWCYHDIADVTSNKKLRPLVTKLSIRGWKLIISLVFIIQTYILSCTKGCKTRHYTLLHYEDSKQTRVSTNFN